MSESRIRVMKLIAEKRGKKDKYDHLRYVRTDGSETTSEMPRQGTLPHDLVHYVVESNLRLKHGFLGLVSQGASAGFVMDAIHDKANPAIETEAIQAEAVVEALQTQLWAGYFDIDAFLEGVRGACAARDKPVYDFGSLNPELMYRQALEINERWSLIDNYKSIELDFS